MASEILPKSPYRVCDESTINKTQQHDVRNDCGHWIPCYDCNLENVMKHALMGCCIYLMGSGAFGAQKPNLSADFANAAVRYLMLVGNYESAGAESASAAQARIASAFQEMS